MMEPNTTHPRQKLKAALFQLIEAVEGGGEQRDRRINEARDRMVDCVSLLQTDIRRREADIGRDREFIGRTESAMRALMNDAEHEPDNQEKGMYDMPLDGGRMLRPAKRGVPVNGTALAS